jgi:hypothetical protein
VCVCVCGLKRGGVVEEVNIFSANMDNGIYSELQTHACADVRTCVCVHMCVCVCVCACVCVGVGVRVLICV